MVDKVELRKWWDIFVGDGNFTEVRILGRFQYSGYFKDFDNLARQLEPYTEMDEEQIYFVLNQIDDSVYGRPQCEKFLKSVKVSTNDNDIISRRFVMCDFDPCRKSSTNSSDEEYQYALDRAKDVYYFLKEQGFEDCIICSSGNGIHLDLKVELPNDEETTEIIKGFFKYMGSRFSDDKVEFDEKNYNLARLCKCYSTVSKKGANIPARPWRQSKILYVPKVLKNTPIERFKALANLVPKEDPKPIPQRFYQRTFGESQPFDLQTWLTQHGITFREKKSGGTTIYELEYCPWVDSHSDRKKWDSALFQDSDGKITFNCTHSHCKDKTWFDFRTFYEPDAYAPKPQQCQQRVSISLPQAIQPVILPETNEKGKKWRGMKDIQKVNINDIPHFLTGFTELDRAIKGLFFCEVTILSGSNSSGKSSLLNTLILNAIQQKVLTALFSGELRPDVLKTWIQMVAAGKEYLRQSQYGGYWYVPDNIGKKIDEWMDGKFFLYNNDYSCKWEQIFNDMHELLKIGVRLFVLDNLMSMDIDIFGGDLNKKQKGLVSQICEFAKQEQAHIILVAHPRKVTTFIRKTDISGSSDLTNAVDNVFIVHRVNNDFKKLGGDFFGQSVISQYFGFGNVIEVCKNRMMGVQDFLCGMYYEMESRRFKNTNDEVKYYGWREEPVLASMQFADMTSANTPYTGQDDMPFPQNESNDEMPF